MGASGHLQTHVLWALLRPVGLALAPVAFVLLWSTGFVVARAAAPYADLSLFLAVRFAVAGLVLAAIALVAGVRWPGGKEAVVHFGIGGLMHGCYLVAGYAAVGNGLPVGLMALIAALQPVFTGGLEAMLGARASRRLWSGIAFGLGGVSLTLAPGLVSSKADFGLDALLLALGSVLALSVATILQSFRSLRADLRTSGALQQFGGAAVAICAIPLIGEWRWDSTTELWLSLIWAAIGLSLGAVGLFIFLIRRDGPGKTSALMLIAPPLAAVQGWLIFGETLSAVQLAGFAVALIGVLVTRGGPRQAAPLREIAIRKS